MSHQVIVVNADEQTTYRKEQILQVLQAIQGIQALREELSFGSIIRGVYLFRDDRTTLELSDDLIRISLAGTGVAALQLALELKARLKTPLRAFDTSYTFDVLLDSVHNLDDFETKVTNGEGV